MGTDLSDERRVLYGEYRKELLSRQLSNSEHFDRSILSLSTGLLALSVAFIRGATPSAGLHSPALLSASWVAFGIAIVFTLASFATSQWAIEQHLTFAKQYYLEKNDGALNRSSGFRTATSWLTALAGAAFVVGVSSTIAFATINLP